MRLSSITLRCLFSVDCTTYCVLKHFKKHLIGSFKKRTNLDLILLPSTEWKLEEGV